jgi:hypothetical protein
MKTDTQKLKKILKLIKTYRKNIDEACNNDCEVTLGCNGINSSEAHFTFKAFEDDVQEILKET